MGKIQGFFHHRETGIRRPGESGQAIVEYILLLSITVTIAMYMIKTMTGKLDNVTARLGATVEKQMRTGSAPASIWKK